MVCVWVHSQRKRKWLPVTGSLLGKAALCMQSFNSHSATRGWILGLEHFLTKLKGLYSLWWACSFVLGLFCPISDSICTPLFCLNVANGTWSTTVSVSCRKGIGVFHSEAQEGYTQANCSLQGPAGHAGPTLTTEADPVLCPSLCE